MQATEPTETFTAGGYAVAMKTVRVKAHSKRPLFIGIARAADLERCLRGTEHDEYRS